VVIDWEVTPNRPDWLSHVGIAREIVAAADRPESFRLPAFQMPEPAPLRAADVTSVEILDPDLCPRYTALVIQGVRIAPSPEWLRRRLEAVGVRPINNVVDVTNYVLMECGQPLHAFDMDLLDQRRIVVRRARAGERITTLDDVERSLTTDDLLIADASRGVALAGIMGGAETEIHDGTTNVLLESAAFLPSAIRATAKRVGLSTEASYRFERGVDIEMVEFASRRAAAMIVELAGGRVLDGVVDVWPGKRAPVKVSCRCSRVNDLLGTALTPSEIRRTFERLQLPVTEATDERITITVPSFRLDLEREADLIEEVARIHGLDNIPPTPEAAAAGGPRSEDRRLPLERIRRDLRALGLDEIMNYSLISVERALDHTGFQESELITLANPLSAEFACVRPCLLPGLLATTAHNAARHNVDLALFELGRVAARKPPLPEERAEIGIVLTGRRHPERYGEERNTPVDFYDLKGLLESLFEAMALHDVRCVPAEHPAFESGQCAAFVRDDKEQLAVFGRVVGDLVREMRLPYPLYIALVQVEALLSAKTPERRYQPLPQFPAVTRDISMIVPRTLSHQDVVDAIMQQRPKWLERVELFDVFEDPKAIGPDKRSMAYSLTYRAPDRTLTDEEVNRAHEKVRQGLAARLPITLR